VLLTPSTNSRLELMEAPCIILCPGADDVVTPLVVTAVGFSSSTL